MDISLIIDQVKQSTDFQTNKKLLKEKIEADLHLSHSNGLFKITPELIAFVSCWDQEILYLKDIYDNPIELNRSEFLYSIKEHYQRIMNEWHQQYHEIKKIRKI